MWLSMATWYILNMCYVIQCDPSCLWLVSSDGPTSPATDWAAPLQWRHNGCDNVSNHQPHDGLLRHRSKKTAKLRVTGFYAGNSPVTGEILAQMASNVENISIWWRHHISCSNKSLVNFVTVHQSRSPLITRLLTREVPWAQGQQGICVTRNNWIKQRINWMI